MTSIREEESSKYQEEATRRFNAKPYFCVSGFGFQGLGVGVLVCRVQGSSFRGWGLGVGV